MGEALSSGLLQGGWPADRLVVVEKMDPRRQELEAEGIAALGTVEAGLDRLSRSGAAIVDVGAVIAVKPTDVQAVGRALGAAGVPRVLSIAAGVTLADLETWIGPDARVLRAMPNTPALVGAAASALSAGTRAREADVVWAEDILRSVGTVAVMPEPALDAVTGLSGSGPAYVFMIAEALIDAGVLVGLARPVARQLAVQTLLGSARLLAETDEEPSALRAAVTSPGGTTAAGLRALEAAGVRAAILEAVVAATERAHQLGQPHS